MKFPQRTKEDPPMARKKPSAELLHDLFTSLLEKN